jgi:nucleoside-diphosphate-sugar epimerase
MAETMTRALVTGARGFIGAALCKRLTVSGIEVHAVSRNPPADAQFRHAQQAQMIQWWKTDLVDLEATRSLIRMIRPDVTFHLASLVTGSRSLEMVLPVFQNSFMTAFNLLMAIAENGAGRIVLAGSLEEPDEVDPVPCSPYAAAKWSASGYARMLHALYQIPIVIAKIFMVYGPGQSDHTKLIPYVTMSLLRGEAPKLSSGARLIDWIYVDDVAEGLNRCAEMPGIDGRTVELGSGEMVSIRDVVQQLSKLVGSGGRPQFGSLPDRPLERVKKADIAESYKLIGWRPSTPLRAGLARTVKWYKDHLKVVDTVVVIQKA